MRRILAALTFSALLAATAAAGPALPELTDKQVETYRELSSKASKMLQDGKAARAVNLYERALRIHDGNEGTWYNLACAHARENRTAEALHALGRALDAGWTNAAWAQEDPDLESVRDTLGFEAWVARAEQAEGSGDWPTVDAQELATDQEAIEERVDEMRAQVNRLRGVLGSSESRDANRWIAAWAAASWDRVAALTDEPDEKAEAKRMALAAVTGDDATRLSGPAAAEALRRAESWLAEFGEAEGAGLARLRHLPISCAPSRRRAAKSSPAVRRLSSRANANITTRPSASRPRRSSSRTCCSSPPPRRRARPSRALSCGSSASTPTSSTRPSSSTRS